MRAHRRIAGLHRGGQFDDDRRRLAARLAPALQGQTHGIGVRHVARERLADRRPQIGGAVAVEQPGQADGDGAQFGAALGGAQPQVAAGRRRLDEPVGGAMLAGGAFGGDQGRDVLGLLDLRPLP